MLEKDSGNFFVNIGENGIEGFEKSTFINTVEFATSKKALKVYFIVSRSNKDASKYRRAFKVASLKRVSTSDKKTLLKDQQDAMVYSMEIE